MIAIIPIIIAIAILAFIFLKLHNSIRRYRLECKADSHNLFNQFEAYNYIKDRLNLKQGIPYTTNWSASPDFLKIVCDHILQLKPSTILECSSGTSTLIASSACNMNDRGLVFSLEHEKKYSNASQENIDRYNLGETGRVIHAPLMDYSLNGTDYKWYDTSQLPDRSIDMLIIDGPPGYIQKNSRYPALPLLFEKLSEECIILLDDAARPDEREIIQFWLDEFEGLTHEFISTERGCSILKLLKES